MKKEKTVATQGMLKVELYFYTLTHLKDSVRMLPAPPVYFFRIICGAVTGKKSGHQPCRFLK